MGSITYFFDSKSPSKPYHQLAGDFMKYFLEGSDPSRSWYVN